MHKHRLSKDRCVVVDVFAPEGPPSARTLISFRKYQPGSSTMFFGGLSGEQNCVALSYIAWLHFLAQVEQIKVDVDQCEALTESLVQEVHHPEDVKANPGQAQNQK